MLPKTTIVIFYKIVIGILHTFTSFEMQECTPHFRLTVELRCWISLSSPHCWISRIIPSTIQLTRMKRLATFRIVTSSRPSTSGNIAYPSAQIRRNETIAKCEADFLYTSILWNYHGELSLSRRETTTTFAELVPSFGSTIVLSSFGRFSTFVLMIQTVD